jgi:endoglucanase
VKRISILLLSLVVPVSTADAMSVRVSGRRLIDDHGHTIRLLGVNRAGTEYACAQGWSIFDGPSSARSVVAMRTWKIRSVAIPLNEACWLGLRGVPAARGGAVYQRAIETYVRTLEAHGIYPILRLSTAAPGSDINEGSHGEIMMADADHAPAFWHSVASTFKDDHAVVFDLYDEPHGLPDWGCWLHGCQITSDPMIDAANQPVGDYRATGMQQLIDAVRSTGGAQPIMLAGMDYAGDLSGWLAHEPSDPRHQLIASFHIFEYKPKTGDCSSACEAAVLNVGRQVPVIIDGFGEYDCNHDYSDTVMGLADQYGFSYLAWTWDTWGCRNGLIANYDGTPTPFGVGVRDHLRKVSN